LTPFPLAHSIMRQSGIRRKINSQANIIAKTKCGW
jgi:hypothetical protein